MSKEWGKIVVYDPSMTAQVAQMFNDFDELWPGGRETWIRNPAPKPFVSPGHLGQPWINVIRGEQSIAALGQ